MKRYGRMKFQGQKCDFGKLWGLICKMTGALLNWKCNLEKTEGLKCKFGGLRAILELFFKNQGLKCKNQGRRVDYGKAGGLSAKWRGIWIFGIYF